MNTSSFDQGRVDREISRFSSEGIQELIKRRSSYATALYSIMTRASRKHTYDEDMHFMLIQDSGLSLAIMAICTILNEDYTSIFDSIARGVCPPKGDRNDIHYWCK